MVEQKKCNESVSSSSCVIDFPLILVVQTTHGMLLYQQTSNVCVHSNYLMKHYTVHHHLLGQLNCFNSVSDFRFHVASSLCCFIIKWNRKVLLRVTQILSMSSVVSIDEQQGVSTVHFAGPCRAFWDLEVLTVSGEEEAIFLWCIHAGTPFTSDTFSTRQARCTFQTCQDRVSFGLKSSASQRTGSLRTVTDY